MDAATLNKLIETISAAPSLPVETKRLTIKGINRDGSSEDEWFQLVGITRTKPLTDGRIKKAQTISASTLSDIAADPYEKLNQYGDEGVFAAYAAAIRGCLDAGGDTHALNRVARAYVALTGLMHGLLVNTNLVPAPFFRHPSGASAFVVEAK